MLVAEGGLGGRERRLKHGATAGVGEPILRWVGKLLLPEGHGDEGQVRTARRSIPPFLGGGCRLIFGDEGGGDYADVVAAGHTGVVGDLSIVHSDGDPAFAGFFDEGMRDTATGGAVEEHDLADF